MQGTGKGVLTKTPCTFKLSFTHLIHVWTTGPLGSHRSYYLWILHPPYSLTSSQIDIFPTKNHLLVKHHPRLWSLFHKRDHTLNQCFTRRWYFMWITSTSPTCYWFWETSFILFHTFTLSFQQNKILKHILSFWKSASQSIVPSLEEYGGQQEIWK